MQNAKKRRRLDGMVSVLMTAFRSLPRAGQLDFGDA
jgi:hypothetical protein